MAFEPLKKSSVIFLKGSIGILIPLSLTVACSSSNSKLLSRLDYALENCEYLTDVRTVAVPIRDYTRTVVGSVAVSGPAYRMSPERIEKEFAPLVLKAGRELSTRLGYNA